MTKESFLKEIENLNKQIEELNEECYKIIDSYSQFDRSYREVFKI